MSNTPRHPQKKVRRLRGECLIEGLPTGAGIPLDGLRLRLDLRFAPASAAETELSPLTEQMPRPGRGFTERIAQRALGVPGAYQRWAMLSGLGTLVLTLALWFFGAAPPRLEESTDAGNPAGAASSDSEKEPERPAPSGFSESPPGSNPVAVSAPEGVGAAPGTGPAASPAVAPTFRVAPPTSALSRGSSAASKPAAASDPAQQRPARPALSAAAGVVETSASPRPRAAQKPTTQRSVETDLRDLFADTK